MTLVNWIRENFTTLVTLIHDSDGELRTLCLANSGEWELLPPDLEADLEEFLEEDNTPDTSWSVTSLIALSEIEEYEPISVSDNFVSVTECNFTNKWYFTSWVDCYPIFQYDGNSFSPYCEIIDGKITKRIDSYRGAEV